LEVKHPLPGEMGQRMFLVGRVGQWVDTYQSFLTDKICSGKGADVFGKEG